VRAAENLAPVLQVRPGLLRTRARKGRVSR
jgi:hypothetical protein